mmetsp:Transcript_5235/g.8978  ORF Transcript_5235/g.8978 Transcript_5235/m.8978 type:complete len:122 (+) Transcript_5235:357-722(+)
MGTAGAGVSGLLRRQQRKQQRLAQLGDQAFSDLGGLIGRAKEVVAVLERYTASHPDEESSEKETSDLNAALATIGYVNPVSRRGGGGGGGALLRAGVQGRRARGGPARAGHRAGAPRLGAG